MTIHMSIQKFMYPKKNIYIGGCGLKMDLNFYKLKKMTTLFVGNFYKLKK